MFNFGGAAPSSQVTSLVVLSTYFIFVFGAEILFLARSAIFSRTPELMQKTLLNESCVIEKIEKNASCARDKIYTAADSFSIYSNRLVYSLFSGKLRRRIVRIIFNIRERIQLLENSFVPCAGELLHRQKRCQHTTSVVLGRNFDRTTLEKKIYPLPATKQNNRNFGHRIHLHRG